MRFPYELQIYDILYLSKVYHKFEAHREISFLNIL